MVLVPMTAVHRGDRKGEGYVYTVVEEAGRQIARRRRIMLDGVHDNRLRIVEGDRTEVRVGDPIVAGGSFRLTEGLVVRAVDIPGIRTRQSRTENKARP